MKINFKEAKVGNEKIMVLVVDDKEGQRSDLKWAAEGKNRHIIEAGEVNEAIRLINKNKFHVIVTDMWLEDDREGGLAVLRAVKKKYPLTQVIVVTAYGHTEKGPKIGVPQCLKVLLIILKEIFQVLII
jgi:DNA-binding NtrC family response regulator